MVGIDSIMFVWHILKHSVYPTEFELRRKNNQFASKSRAGKNPVKPSRQEQLAKRSPISLWALGAIVFVVVGGGVFQFDNYGYRQLIALLQCCLSSYELSSSDVLPIVDRLVTEFLVISL